ncbi:MAG: N-acetylmuramoyl-L-alanine amidase [Chitinophagaceae bacterium]|nr:N-acetylmuramoyl-L-alanine amidase [Chitinophagaceae bacterium]
MRFQKFILILAILFGLSIYVGCSSSKKVQKKILNLSIASRSAWNADNPRLYKTHVPVRITVHHEGTQLLLTDDAAKKIKRIQTWGMGKDRNWTDIPYHFLIAPDGTIYEGRNVHTVGETATEYDPSGHLLITCLGNFEKQEVFPEQLSSLIRLIAYCSIKYSIPVETLSTHRDNSAQTTCPGKNLYHYFENGYVLAEVIKLLK